MNRAIRRFADTRRAFALAVSTWAAFFLPEHPALADCFPEVQAMAKASAVLAVADQTTAAESGGTVSLPAVCSETTKSDEAGGRSECQEARPVQGVEAPGPGIPLPGGLDQLKRIKGQVGPARIGPPEPQVDVEVPAPGAD